MVTVLLLAVMKEKDKGEIMSELEILQKDGGDCVPVDVSLTTKLIDRAYKCACAHGFHNAALSVEHCLMLVLSEIGEAVEADRRGNRCDIVLFENNLGSSSNGVIFKHVFERHIKDSVEDELADACIRLYDMCGLFFIAPQVEYGGLDADFKNIFGGDSFCERMFYLSKLLCDTNGVLEDDSSDACLPRVIGQCLSFLFACAHDIGIDLLRHIELKMRYNELRPMLNGKKY